MSMNEDNRSQSSGYGPGMQESQQALGGVPGGQNYGADGGGAMGGVRGMASQAGEKLMDTAEQQKQHGAEYMVGMAGAVRRAASEFDDQMPSAAQYIRMAADQMESMSDSLRRRDVRQMMSDVQSFAQRQPAAFLGMSLLAGFAAVRFLRSSSPGGFSSNGNGMSGSGRSSGMTGSMSGGTGGSMGSSSFDDDGRYGSTSSSPGSMSAPGSGTGM